LYDKIKDDKKTAILVSHAHQDHYGLLDFVQNNIPVYLGKITLEIIEFFAYFFNKPKIVKNPQCFESETVFTFGDFEITPYLVDHAVPDSYAFYIRADGTTLFYSGDFRAHGRKKVLFKRFLYAGPKNVDYLLLEGTAINRDGICQTEEDLEEEFTNVFTKTKGINLVLTSSLNLDRLVSVFRAAKRANKIFVVDFFVANILTTLHNAGCGTMYPAPHNPRLKVFFPYSLCEIIPDSKKQHLMYDYKNYKITAAQITADADKIVMIVRAAFKSSFEHMTRLNAGNVIFSLWNGYRKDKKINDFISLLLGRGLNLISLHTSGHADIPTLKKLEKALSHKHLVPIHTDVADKYKEIFPKSDILKLQDDQIVICSSLRQNNKTTDIVVSKDKQKNGVEKPGKTEEDAENLCLIDLLLKIGSIHQELKKTVEEAVEKARPYIKIVCRMLDITELQAVILSDIIHCYDGYEISVEEISKIMNCPASAVFKYLDKFEELEHKNLIEIRRESSFGRQRGISFNIPYETMDAFRMNKAPENKFAKKMNIDEFFEAVYELCEMCVQEKEGYDNIVLKLDTMLQKNNHLGIVRKLKGYSINTADILIVLRFCHYYIDLEQDEMSLSAMEQLYEYSSMFRSAKQQLKNGTHILQQKNIIKNVNEGEFVDPNIYKLTDAAKEELLYEIEDQIKAKPFKGLLLPETVKEKPLFYPEKTKKQIEELTAELQEDNFAKMQKNLADKNMRIGFACLFSGPPGTGKTETVYQIAKHTNRCIMQVDIAETKSMWFGESEKLIKQVFTRYRKAVKKLKITPILLFNEADAIIGKRQNLGESRSGAGQTENAIQNIILQEIENLNGILIATTNLAVNMDKAFERRFLHKIEFEKPGIESRLEIWKSMLPDIPIEQLQKVAQKYDFSGGQIENLARHNIIKSSMSGNPLTFEELAECCDNETNEDHEKKHIGFR
jgi:hypothetical protein